MSGRARWVLLLMAGTVAAASCDFATDVELLEIGATGAVVGQAYLDANGDEASDASDDPLADASILLTTVSGGKVVVEAVTDSLGAFVMLDVPVGAYNLSLDSAVLGDTLEVIGPVVSVTVERGDTASFSLGASYPVLSLEEVRAAAPGRRVFTLGVAMNPRTTGTDGTVHVIDTAAVSYLRATGVSVLPGNIVTGDSLRLLGRTAVNNGQTVLDAVTPFLLLRGLTLPPPVEASIAEAKTADGGGLDAALVRIRTAEITDTSSAPNGDFHFWAYDGTDSIEVVYKWFRNISHGSIRPDTIVRLNQATGLLTPFDDGTGITTRWRLLPRGGSEVALENKGANLAVTTAYDVSTATATDTVEITVVVQNLPPIPTLAHATATGVTVTDTIPAALNVLSYTTTSGSAYSVATHIWNVGDLAPNAADTLRVSLEVTGGPGTAVNTARTGPLSYEVETPTGDNQASDTLTIS